MIARDYESEYVPNMDRDHLMGQTVARIRGNRTQQSVADAMRERGHKWSQATVWSVESGERPLRASEAESLAHVLRVPLAGIFAIPDEAFAIVEAEGVFAAATEMMVTVVGTGADFLTNKVAIREVVNTDALAAVAPNIAERLSRLGRVDEHALAESMRAVAEGELIEVAISRLLGTDWNEI